MSTLRVEVVEIRALLPIPNAHSLELAMVEGWQVIVGKGQYQPGDLAVYFPIDAVLSEETEKILFSPDSKVKLHRRRVKTVKIRGVISQGLLGAITDLALSGISAGTDVAERLGVTKYEPPERFEPPVGKHGKKRSPPVNPNFQKFTDIENVKWWPNLFAPGEVVSITEKIHGTNFRCGWVKAIANTWWKRVKKFFGKFPEYEFVYGSRNVQFMGNYKGYYSSNVYAETVEAYNLKEKLLPGEVLYGEIYGSGIQKGYNYGCKEGVRKLAIFDINKDGVYQSSLFVTIFCQKLELPRCPVLYHGPFNPEVLAEQTRGPSVLAPEQRVREGCVVRPEIEEQGLHGRKILKSISPEYLLKNQDNETGEAGDLFDVPNLFSKNA